MHTIQQILQDHFDELIGSRTLSAPQYRAASALRKCRSPNGHVERAWYNSCRNRACPHCNGWPARWLARNKARLIDCAH